MVGGLTSIRVIVVSTSVGYGVGIGGSLHWRACSRVARPVSRSVASTTASARRFAPPIRSAIPVRGTKDDMKGAARCQIH